MTNPQAQHLYDLIQDDIQRMPLDEFMLSPDEEQNLRSQKMKQIFALHTQSAAPEVQRRIHQEIHSWGPLSEPINDETISEIIVNGPESIWLEKKGRLERHTDHFFSDLSYRNCLDRICHAANTHITKEHPCADGQFESFRLSLVGADLTRGDVHFTLRRHPTNPWNFQRLREQNWCSEADLGIIQRIQKDRKNFLVVGTTGSGKTSVLNAFLNLVSQDERVVIIEDTPEIAIPNEASMRLVTREDPQGVLPAVDQMQLVKRTLRLRPDRIVMGEVRGAEAKDFLMALATGHGGSFGTLHAQDASQALLRLEMLIQMGAPQWGLQAIRRLIQLSLDYVIVTEKSSAGDRRLKGIYRLCSLEDNGFLLEPALNCDF